MALSQVLQCNGVFNPEPDGELDLCGAVERPLSPLYYIIQIKEQQLDRPGSVPLTPPI